MGKYVIDGLFLTQTISGIQRFSYELTAELDKIAKKDEFEILVPDDTEVPVDYQNIKVIRYGKHHGILWQQLDYGGYVRKNRKACLCLTNIIPLSWAKGCVVIHDVCYKAKPEFFTGVRGTASALWHRINYWFVSRSKMKIFTVSEFSKSEIIRYYHVEPERISIFWNAWQHMERINATSDVFDRYTQLIPEKYFFSMSNLAPNKNLQWILSAARNNPEYQFAVAGGGSFEQLMERMEFKDLHNIYFLGYVSDEDAKALLAHCKAFIFPTFYEGFGIPPLEAVACGAPEIIVSDTPCMREVYGKYAHYIDPKDYSYVFPEIMEKKDYSGLLEKYSWNKSAEKILRTVRIK